MYAGLVQNLTMFSHIKTSPVYLYVSPDMWRQLLTPARTCLYQPPQPGL